MPEMIRSLTARLREFIGNRRRAPRYSARLSCNLSIVEARGANNSGHQQRRPATIAGHTCDVSSSGLGLVVPAVRIGDQYLTGEARALRLVLELPEATIQMRVLPVRHEQLQGDQKAGFLIGVRILELSAEDRAHYTAQLKKLSAQKPL